jgi:hypothetical protein
MPQKLSKCQPKIVKLEVKEEATLKPTWELAIADAEERIARLHRSIAMFKQNVRMGIPFPEPSTRN